MPIGGDPWEDERWRGVKARAFLPQICVSQVADRERGRGDRQASEQRCPLDACGFQRMP